MAGRPKWGVVATIKAPAREILGFAAHHLELGAERLFLYLDAPCPEVMPHLHAHDRIRAQVCTDQYWDRLLGRRPAAHQARQGRNATHAYERATGLDWLTHIDVDEFLWPDADVSAHLGVLTGDILSARVRPAEQLSGDATAFKRYIPQFPGRGALVDRLYPDFGRYLRGGFLSHAAGKLFVRTGMAHTRLRIHNIERRGQDTPEPVELPSVTLLHCHAKSWEHWLQTYRYRLRHGSYRAELKPARSADATAINLHTLFQLLEAEDGESGLRRFFDEVCADSPELRQRLQNEGLFHRYDLNLVNKIAKQFPQAV